MGHIGNQVILNRIAFMHETALLFGRVKIGEGSSVFPYVIMRAEMHEIVIGERTNVQDHVVVHVGDRTPTIVGDDCSITHHVTLHGCTIGDRCLIGINSTIMDGAKIGANSIVAGHSLVRQGDVFSENSVIAGVPAQKIDERDCSEQTLLNAKFYEAIGRNYSVGKERLTDQEIAQILGSR